MPKKKPRKKSKPDVNETAFAFVRAVTSESKPSKRSARVVGAIPAAAESKNGKNPAAVALGRLGGLKGGRARAAKLSPERRTEIAREGGRKRWGKKGAD